MVTAVHKPRHKPHWVLADLLVGLLATCVGGFFAWYIAHRWYTTFSEMLADPAAAHPFFDDFKNNFVSTGYALGGLTVGLLSALGAVSPRKRPVVRLIFGPLLAVGLAVLLSGEPGRIMRAFAPPALTGFAFAIVVARLYATINASEAATNNVID
jgi:hypothetical protein